LRSVLFKSPPSEPASPLNPLVFFPKGFLEVLNLSSLFPFVFSQVSPDVLVFQSDWWFFFEILRRFSFDSPLFFSAFSAFFSGSFFSPWVRFFFQVPHFRFGGCFFFIGVYEPPPFQTPFPLGPSWSFMVFLSQLGRRLPDCFWRPSVFPVQKELFGPYLFLPLF